MKADHSISKRGRDHSAWKHIQAALNASPAYPVHHSILKSHKGGDCVGYPYSAESWAISQDGKHIYRHKVVVKDAFGKVETTSQPM